MKPRFRVPISDLGHGQKLVLEMEAGPLLPVTQDLAMHLEDIRTMLVRGAIGPAKAHVLLLKTVRLNRERLLRMVDSRKE